ncbi:MAG: helix-turn-helix transcriptional regulator [Deltaproteobacteria bacterium]|jgi:DNA-binding CsgD family transcriptional regulator|nr:helix-turn-helix transcriptional regulator [Deltaproteobacteria bacterium]
MNHTSKTEKDDATLFSAELARTVLNSLSAHIAILDENGVILETNTAWRNYADKSGMPDDYDDRGSNYLAVCDATTGSESDDARKVAEGIRAVLRGDLEEFLYDYPCHSEDGPHWYYLRAIRMSGPGPIRVVASHEEITVLKLTEEALRKSQEALIEQKQSLEEANIAMKVLLKQREEDKLELEKKVLNNVKDLVLPYVEKLKNSRLKGKDRTLVDIVDTHLQDIISPLLQRFSNAKILLTPQEMHVASLVKDGKTSKEIADVLNVSETTVNFHRKNLRVKFGLRNKRTNLRSYLLSISQ